MHQVEHLYLGDILIAAVVIGSQSWLGWMHFTRWRGSLPRWMAGTTTVFLAVVWTICAFSILVHFSNARPVPSLLRGMVSAVEIIWGLLSLNGAVVYFLYHRAARVVGAERNPGRRRLLQSAAAAAMVVPASAIAFGGFIERTQFTVREIEFPIPRLHPDFDGFRVAQITDIHAGPYLSVREVARAVDMVNELKPHLTLITGDLITQAGDPLDATLNQLARLRADTGLLGCLGNHEIYAECEDYVTAEGARRGMQYLRDQARRIAWGQGELNVAGVDFQSFRHKERYLQNAGPLVVDGMANLLLSHNPDVFPVAVARGYDAVVGGHTHGGQVNVEVLRQDLNPARFFTPFVRGLHRIGASSLYISAGLGTIGMPVRLGAPPEITLLRLRRA